MINNPEASQKMLRLIGTAAKMHDLKIYDVEFNTKILKIFIEHKTSLPVDLDACEKFMKSTLFLFESENIKDIDCEVSSPGLERKLRQEKHFESAVGKKVRIYTKGFIFSDNQQKKATVLNGHLQKYKNKILQLNDGKLDWTIPVNSIKKAHAVFENKNQIKR